MADVIPDDYPIKKKPWSAIMHQSIFAILKQWDVNDTVQIFDICEFLETYGYKRDCERDDYPIKYKPWSAIMHQSINAILDQWDVNKTVQIVEICEFLETYGYKRDCERDTNKDNSA